MKKNTSFRNPAHDPATDPVSGWIAAWVAGVGRWPITVGALCLLASAGLLWIAVATLTINTSTNDMLSVDLPFRQNNEAVDAAFPQTVDSLILAVEGPDGLAAAQATTRLAAALAARPDRFQEIYLPEDSAFFRRNGLLFLSPHDLQAQGDRLAAAQPLLAALQRDPSLRGLTGLLGDAFAARQESLAIAELGPLLGRLAAVAEALAAGKGPQDPAARLDWLGLLDGGLDGGPVDSLAAAEDRRHFVIVKPVIDFASLAPLAGAVAAVEAAAQDLGLTEAAGYRLLLTGEALMLQDELVSVRKGIGYVGLLSAVLVAIVLFGGLRSWRLVVPVLVTLVAGLAWTAGFAALAVGELNIISVAFAVLFIGLSVDFGIHFVLRVQEHPPAAGSGPQNALVRAAGLVGRPLALCALSSALAFFAFFPTAYRGLSELGLIAGAGMFIALFLNLTLLPALLCLLPAGPVLRLGARHPGASQPGHSQLGPVATLAAGLQRRIGRHAAGLAGLAGLLALAALFALPQLRFDDDPFNLRDAASPSVAALLELQDDPRVSPYSAQVLAEDAEDNYRDTVARLEALPLVEAAITLDSFLPGDQATKLDIIDQTALFLTPLFTAPPPLPAPSAEEGAAALQRLQVLLAAPPVALEVPAARLLSALKTLGAVPPAALDAAWLGGFPAALERLLVALEAEEITPDSLPDDLRRRYEAADGRKLIEVVPVEDLRDPAARLRFVAAVQAVVPNASGAPVTIVEAGRAVVTAFVQASLLALCAIALLLLIVLRSPLDTLLVLLPLVLAALLTAAAAVVFGLPFNFANVIVLPLLLGLGVDSGIHLVLRAREAAGVEPAAAAGGPNSTPRAILLSALTTVASFGALAFSAHPGTASMGLLLTLGIAITLVCVLAFLPALLVLAGRLPRL